MRDGDRGETIVPKHQPIATRLASQSSAIRLRLSGAAAVLSISMEQTRRPLSRLSDHCRPDGQQARRQASRGDHALAL